MRAARQALVAPLVCAALVAAAGAAATSAAASFAALPKPSVRDGEARFQVLSPTLVRLEYARDGRFENRRTLTAIDRRFGAPRFTTAVRDGWRKIRTRRLRVRYRRGSGPFGPDNLKLRVRVGDEWVAGTPEWGEPPPNPTDEPPPIVTGPMPDPDPAPRTAGNLGGWYRGLDNQRDPVELHDGILSRDGWYLLDDSFSPVLTRGAPGYELRPQDGYQDGYLFGYGHDYRRGLRDFARLTGRAPLLPRKAFGTWFSRYFAYGEQDFKRITARFRSERVPLDVIVVDTDFKRPHRWNGWSWREELFPDPRRFFRWAGREGLEVALNVHPSITTDDPRYAEADRRAGGLTQDVRRCRIYIAVTDPGPPDQVCGVFDLAQPDDVDSYFWLHEPFERQGADFWWMDWCCDEAEVDARWMTPDTWANLLYARRSEGRGSRWLSFSRIGGSFWDYHAAFPGAFAEHRYSLHFTGDAYDTWQMLDFQTRFTAAEGAGIGLPYVSHDIGSFHGDHLPDEMYVRWVQSGLVQPLLRLHSDHGDRLPWDYGGEAQRIATEFLRLRGALVPYLYTLARQAHDRGLPIARAMYLGWPERDAAYTHDRQYMLGRELLAAPVGEPGDPAEKEVWFPPGEWVDWFTGEVHRGPAAKTLSVPLERMPLFARAGSVVPSAPYARHSERPLRELELDVFAGDRGRFVLYEDAGEGFGYRRGRFTRTPFRHRERAGTQELRLGAARGGFPGDVERRSYEVTFHGVGRPRRVELDGERIARSGGRGWSYDRESGALTVRTGRLATGRRAELVVRGRGA